MNQITFLLFFSCLMVLIADATGFQEYGKYSTSTERISGLFANPNEAGVQANLALAFTIVYWVRQKSWIKSAMVAVAIVIELYTAILTFSKAAFILSLVLIGMFIVFYLLYSQQTLNFRSRKKINFFGILLLMFGLHVFINYYDDFYDNLTIGQQERVEEVDGLLKGKFDEETTSYRVVTYNAGIKLIDENPVTGYGLGVFQRLPNLGKGVHNIYLMIWGESGIIGFLAYVLLILVSFYYAVKIKNFYIKILCLGIMLVFTASGFVSHNILDDRSLNSLVGIFLALSRAK